MTRAWGGCVVVRSGKLLAWSIALLIGLVPSLARGDIEDSIVHIQVSFKYADGRVEQLPSGSGFLIDRVGRVVTAQHVIPKVIPAGATLVIEGTTRSPGNPRRPLYVAQNVDLRADIALVRFDPQAQASWPYLKISRRTTDLPVRTPLVAWGFAFDGGLTGADTRVESALGVQDTVRVGAGIHPGMSGGPMLDKNDHVVGVITGGAAGVQTINFYTPIYKAKPLIESFAEYVGPEGPVVRTFEVRENHDIGQLPSQAYSVPFYADSGLQITNARFDDLRAAGVSDVTLTVAGDGKSVTLSYVVRGGSARNVGTVFGKIITEQK
jgi:S1-C subfamily serine protease